MADTSDIIIDDDVITEDEQKHIDKEIFNLPFFMQNATKDIKMMSHIMVNRDDHLWNEQPFYFFQNILVRFCDKHSLPIDRIYRAAINLGTENSKHKRTHPHIDIFREGYKVVIIYLNDVVDEPEYNSTIVYKEKAKDSKEDTIDFSDMNKLTVEKEIFPKKGRIVCFDGMRYHANYFSKGNEYRCVAVFNFT
jgi:hypothetical protein